MNMDGPGWILLIMRAVMMTRVVPLPGIPRVIVGISAPPVTALLQALVLPTDEPDPDSLSFERAAKGQSGEDPEADGGGTTRVARAGKMSFEQNAKLHMILKGLCGDDREKARVWVGWALTGEKDAPVESIGALSREAASRAIDVLSGVAAGREAEQQVEGGVS